MRNLILLIGALLELTSVGMGTYIDHGLSHHVDLKTLSMPKTALLYHQLYAVMISVIGFYLHSQKNLLFKIAAWVFIIGSSLFSFSIYLTAITGIVIFTKLTPMGGIMLMIAWLLLAYAAFYHTKKSISK